MIKKLCGFQMKLGGIFSTMKHLLLFTSIFRVMNSCQQPDASVFGALFVLVIRQLTHFLDVTICQETDALASSMNPACGYDLLKALKDQVKELGVIRP